MHYIIVGSGVAATTLAYELLKDDKNSITMFEAGPAIPMMDYRKWLDFQMSERAPYVHCLDSDSAEQSPDSIALLEGSRLIMRGGSTNHWGGWALRFQPEDFELNSRTGKGMDWPFSYKDLVPFYIKAEEFLGVTSSSTQTSQPALAYTQKDGLIIPHLKRLKINYEPMPMARFLNKCVTTGTCDYCPFGARFSAGLMLERLIVQYPERLHLKVNTPVVRLNAKSNRALSGVGYLENGILMSEQADRIILCAGAIETPKLILNNSTPELPLGNQSGHVGRHLTAHQLLKAVGMAKTSMLNAQHGVDFPTLAIRHFDSPDFQALGKGFFVHAGPTGSPKLASLITSNKQSDISGYLNSGATIELRGFIEYVDDADDNFVRSNGKPSLGSLQGTYVHYANSAKSSAREDFYLNELSRILRDSGLSNIKSSRFSNIRLDHAVSTCRMHQDASKGVVSETLSMHGMDNVFICSNAVFPSGAAVNPTLTLTALAFKLAEHLKN